MNPTCLLDDLPCAPKFKTALHLEQAKDIFLPLYSTALHSKLRGEVEGGDLFNLLMRGSYEITSCQDIEISSLLDIKHKCH